MTSIGGFRVFPDFAAAEPAWRAFEQTADHHGFQRFDWLRTWHEEIGASEVEPLIVEVADEAGETVMLLPLGRVERGRTRVLTWLGGRTSDYHGPLVAPGLDLDHLGGRGLWDALRAVLPRYDSVHFEQQLPMVGESRHPGVRPGAVPHQPAMAASLHAGWRARLPKKWQRDHRRLSRRLDTEGEVRFTVATDPETAASITTTMMAQKSRHFQESGHWAMFDDDRHRSFYLRMAREGAPAGVVHVSALTCGADVLATEWSLLTPKCCYGLLASYDRDWSRYSPGRLLLERVFDWCVGRGIEVYDFVTGDEAYKGAWCDRSTYTYEYLEATTARGFGYTVPRSLMRRTKNVVKAHPRAYAFARKIRG